MDDAHVAQVLAKEARDSSQKYSTEGLGAYMPVRKPAANAPKPNTRFLRHLIKETDNHNLALKRKEGREARDRMRQLRDQSTTGSTSTSHTSRRHDRRGPRDSERYRAEDHDDRHRSHRRRHRSRSVSTDRDRDRDRSRRNRRKDEDYEREGGDHGDRTERRRGRHRHDYSRTDQRERKRSYSRSRSRSPRRDHTSRRHRSERHHRGSVSPSGTRSSCSHREKERRTRKEDKPSHTNMSPSNTGLRESKASPPTTLLGHNSADDSDPLEDLVGPLPQNSGEAPIRSRGRGAYKPNSSTIDAHFAPDYDPTLDVQLDENGGQLASQRRPVAGLMTGEDDWDMALEALRDRAHWRKKGEERLRAAGMNENAIDRWKGNAAFSGIDGEGRPEDVRWSKKGEGREWDRGKYVNDDGHIDVRAAWQS